MSEIILLSQQDRWSVQQKQSAWLFRAVNAGKAQNLQPQNFRPSFIHSSQICPLTISYSFCWNQAENCAGAARSWLAKIWCKTNLTKSKRKFSFFHVFSNFQSLLKTSKMFWHRQSIFEACWRYLATCLCELIKMKHSVYLVKKFKPVPVL